MVGVLVVIQIVLCDNFRLVEPDVDVDGQNSSARSSPGPGTPHRRSHTLAPGAIPVQRVITPIREEDKSIDSKGASPVDYKPIKLPDPLPASPDEIHARDMRHRSKSESALPDHNGSASTSRSGSSDDNTESIGHGPGFEDLQRVESPPPADEVIAQRKNESRYRLCLQHNFHPSCTLSSHSKYAVHMCLFILSDIAVMGTLTSSSGGCRVFISTIWAFCDAFQCL